MVCFTKINFTKTTSYQPNCEQNYKEVNCTSPSLWQHSVGSNLHKASRTRPPSPILAGGWLMHSYSCRSHSLHRNSSLMCTILSGKRQQAWVAITESSITILCCIPCFIYFSLGKAKCEHITILMENDGYPVDPDWKLWSWHWQDWERTCVQVWQQNIGAGPLSWAIGPMVHRC